jgi:hypothetical protein
MQNELRVYYATFKTAILARTLPFFYVAEIDSSYTLYSVTDNFLIASSASGDDATDFTTNWQASGTEAPSKDDAILLCAGSNLIAPRAADGRPDFRMTAANKARNFNLRIFSFVAGDSSTLSNQDANFNALSDITMTCYDVSGDVTTDPTAAVKTVLDLEPSFNYEIIGGWINTPTSLFGGTTGEWWISAVGVPDIPLAYGGSINFVYPANLELVSTNQIVSDGRASQYLTYNPTYHTNKLRWIVKHPTSAGLRIQIYVETFV